jgi:hypothetical protein
VGSRAGSVQVSVRRRRRCRGRRAAHGGSTGPRGPGLLTRPIRPARRLTRRSEVSVEDRARRSRRRVRRPWPEGWGRHSDGRYLGSVSSYCRVSIATGTASEERRGNDERLREEQGKLMAARSKPVSELYVLMAGPCVRLRRLRAAGEGGRPGLRHDRRDRGARERRHPATCCVNGDVGRS